MVLKNEININIMPLFVLFLPCQPQEFCFFLSDLCWKVPLIKSSSIFCGSIKGLLRSGQNDQTKNYNHA